MRDFVTAFTRNPDGSWVCVAPASFSGSHGAVSTTPGRVYRKGELTYGYDIAQWLEDWAQHGSAPAGIVFSRAP